MYLKAEVHGIKVSAVWVNVLYFFPFFFFFQPPATEIIGRVVSTRPDK